MVKSNRTICKNLLFRLKKIKAESIYRGLESLSECQEISAINKIVDSPSEKPMIKGHYFLTEKILQEINLPYDETKIPLYIAGDNSKGIVVYLTPKSSKQKLYETLISMRQRRKEDYAAA